MGIIFWPIFFTSGTLSKNATTFFKNCQKKWNQKKYRFFFKKKRDFFGFFKSDLKYILYFYFWKIGDSKNDPKWPLFLKPRFLKKHKGDIVFRVFWHTPCFWGDFRPKNPKITILKNPFFSKNVTFFKFWILKFRIFKSEKKRVPIFCPKASLVLKSGLWKS